MPFETVESLEIKLKEYEDLLNKFSSDNLKSMLCVQEDISDKPSMIVNDLGSSTSHAFNSEIKSLFIKPMIVDIACLDNCENSCLKNCAEHKSEDHQRKETRCKFVPTCHHCGIIGHIRPNCYLLKSHKSWNKLDAPKKGSVEDPSSSKYVILYRRHISQRDKRFFICENANSKFEKLVKKHSNKRSQPTCHLCGVSRHIRPHCPQIRTQKPRIKKQEPKKGKPGSNPSKPYHAPRQKPQFPQRAHPSCCHCGKTGHTKAECFKLKPRKPKENQIFEGLVSMMKSVLVRLDELNKAPTHEPKVNKVWVRKDKTIHPLRGSGLT